MLIVWVCIIELHELYIITMQTRSLLNRRCLPRSSCLIKKCNNFQDGKKNGKSDMSARKQSRWSAEC